MNMDKFKKKFGEVSNQLNAQVQKFAATPSGQPLAPAGQTAGSQQQTTPLVNPYHRPPAHHAPGGQNTNPEYHQPPFQPFQHSGAPIPKPPIPQGYPAASSAPTGPTLVPPFNAYAGAAAPASQPGPVHYPPVPHGFPTTPSAPPPHGHPATGQPCAQPHANLQVPHAAPAHASAPGGLHGLAVIDRRFVFAKPVELKLREAAMSMTGDDFTIDDAITRQPWFRISGALMSMQQRKVLTDNANRPVAHFTSNLLSLRGSMTVSDPHGRPLFQVTPQLKLLDKEMTATVRNLADGAATGVVVKGNFRGSRCVIFVGDPKFGGRQVAEVHKQTINIKTMLTGAQTYTLTVQPGVDVAMCVLLALAFDEKYHDQNG